ncbi:M15 family metallopeptidase [Eupransor demetentiae]|uniref:LAS superfamily (LdcB) n=1 Tax=Eupransor demetentiae TaxID=3109584 RepID=A0ABM9N5D1_9LACO|nr:LAS superfamily (LdcB) [Lactobacillaceae bacterium LMG 33000]
MWKQLRIWSFTLAAILLIIALQATLGTHKVGQKQTVAQKTTSSLPKGVKASDWDLVLVNKQHMLKHEMNFPKATLEGKIVDQRIVSAVEDFQKGAQQAGYATTLVSGYRSIADQTQVFNQVLQNNEAGGDSYDKALAATKAVVQTPGSSEHHTGQAIDLAGNDALAKYPGLEGAMDQFASQKWLIEHAPDYGFILRFPADKKGMEETGIDYESWHFRYVGVKNAKYMTKHHLTLEAYVKELNNRAKKQSQS